MEETLQSHWWAGATLTKGFCHLLRWPEVTLLYRAGVPGANWWSLDRDCVWFLPRLGPRAMMPCGKRVGVLLGGEEFVFFFYFS